MNHHTRLRVYYTGGEGCSASLIVDDHFTLIGAKVTYHNTPNISEEIKFTGKDYFDVLHIPSWDVEHCDETSLRFILRHWTPRLIEYPAFSPDTDTVMRCLRLIEDYSMGEKMEVVPWKVYYSQQRAKVLENGDIFFSPIHLGENKSDNSVVKLFRRGSFQILSLGVSPSEEIRKYLKENEILKTEVDVVLLRYNDLKNSDVVITQLLESISPCVIILLSNSVSSDVQPTQIIRYLPDNLKICTLSPDKGDIIIESTDTYSFKVYNLSTVNKECPKSLSYRNKTFYTDER